MSASTNKKSNPSSTEHWQSASWSVEVKSGAHISTLDLRRPFALVGSHRCCHLRVSSRRVPDVAFFICCFGEQVEAWELPCHETMTGRILTPDLPLEVGPCSLTFSPRTVDDQENQTSPRFQVSTQLDTDGNSLQRSFDSRVTFICDSTLDLIPTGTDPATHAVVNQDGGLWIIDLSPRRMRRTERVRRLSRIDNETNIGKTKLTLTDVQSVEFNGQPNFLNLEFDEESVTTSESASSIVRDQGAADGEQETTTKKKKRRKKRRGKKNSTKGIINPPADELHAPSIEESAEEESAEEELSEPELSLLYESSEVLGTPETSVNLNDVPQASTVKGRSFFSGIAKTIGLIGGLSRQSHQQKEKTKDADPAEDTTASDQNNPTEEDTSKQQPNDSHNESDENSILAQPNTVSVGDKPLNSNLIEDASTTMAILTESETNGSGGIALGQTKQDSPSWGLPNDQWFSTLAVGEGLAEVSPPVIPQAKLKLQEAQADSDENALGLEDQDANAATADDDANKVDNPDNPHNRHNPQIQPKDQDIETGSETLPPSVEIHCDENTGQHANDVSSDPTYDHSLGMSDSAVETPEFTETMPQNSPLPSVDSNASAYDAPVVKGAAKKKKGSVRKAAKGPASNVDGNSKASDKQNQQIAEPNPRGHSTNTEVENGYTDMSSLSYFPTEETDLSQEGEQRIAAHDLPRDLESGKTDVSPSPKNNLHHEELFIEEIDREEIQDSVAQTAKRNHIRQLSDYKVDPDILTTEISVRLAHHVAPSRSLFATLRKLFIILLIIAVHVVVFYYVGLRIYELLHKAN